MSVLRVRRLRRSQQEEEEILNEADKGQIEDEKQSRRYRPWDIYIDKPAYINPTIVFGSSGGCKHVSSGIVLCISPLPPIVECKPDAPDELQQRDY